MLSKNKGEWSEVLVLARCLIDGELPIVDADLKVTNKVPLKVIEVSLRNGPTTSWSSKTFTTASNEDAKFSPSQVAPLAERLQKELLLPKSSSYESVPGNAILRTLGISENKSSDKVDIWLKVVSPLNSDGEWLGFSIKSHVGGASTLLNASSKTNFIFRVWHENKHEIRSLYSEDQIQKRIQKFINSGGHLELISMAGEEFEDNLDTEDPRLKSDLSEILVDYYSSKRTDLRDLVSEVSRNHKESGFEKKLQLRLRRLLLDLALGMVPGSYWSTRLQAYGGYVVVKDSGQVVCLPASNQDALGDYIFQSTFLDTPSTKRHNFGTPFEVGGETRLALNLQIRFRG